MMANTRYFFFRQDKNALKVLTENKKSCGEKGFHYSNKDTIFNFILCAAIGIPLNLLPRGLQRSLE
jgi:hypothetical protein